MSPFNAAICTTISYTLWVEWYYIKKQLFDLEAKGQGPTKVITVRDPPLCLVQKGYEKRAMGMMATKKWNTTQRSIKQAVFTSV